MKQLLETLIFLPGYGNIGVFSSDLYFHHRLDSLLVETRKKRYTIQASFDRSLVADCGLFAVIMT